MTASIEEINNSLDYATNFLEEIHTKCMTKQNQ